MPEIKIYNEHDTTEASACGVWRRRPAQNPQAEACATQSKALRAFSYPNLFGLRVERTYSLSAETLGPYAPTRAASTGNPRRSAASMLIPAPSSSERLKPTAGST